MKYYKNTELARLYNVSEKSVRNWVEASRNGKMQLELYEDNGKVFIADTIKNEALLENFTLRAKKYRNSYSHRKISPSDIFYELYSHDQIIDIITSLDTYREIPVQYRYTGPAAIYWTSYFHKLYATERNNMMTDSIVLLNLSQEYINHLTTSFEKVNVIDLGAGNGLSAKDFLLRLQKTGKLSKYIAIDISPELLAITKHNIETWSGRSIHVETHIKDLVHDKLHDVIAGNTLKNESTVNIILLLGGTFSNFRDQQELLTTIRNGMSKDDIFIITTKTDSPAARKFFDFSIDTSRDAILSPAMRQIPELLGIDSTLYEIEQVFNENTRARTVSIKLNVAMSITFTTNCLDKTVTLEKGERILLWRNWHQSFEEHIALFNKSGHECLQSTTTDSQELILLISKVRAGNPELQ